MKDLEQKIDNILDRLNTLSDNLYDIRETKSLLEWALRNWVPLVGELSMINKRLKGNRKYDKTYYDIEGILSECGLNFAMDDIDYFALRKSRPYRTIKLRTDMVDTYLGRVTRATNMYNDTLKVKRVDKPNGTTIVEISVDTYYINFLRFHMYLEDMLEWANEVIYELEGEYVDTNLKYKRISRMIKAKKIGS